MIIFTDQSYVFTMWNVCILHGKIIKTYANMCLIPKTDVYKYIYANANVICHFYIADLILCSHMLTLNFYNFTEKKFIATDLLWHIKLQTPDLQIQYLIGFILEITSLEKTGNFCCLSSLFDILYCLTMPCGIYSQNNLFNLVTKWWNIQDLVRSHSWTKISSIFLA